MAVTAVLSGCAGSDTPPPGSSDCGGGAPATVSATAREGRSWQTEVPLPTDRPPQVGGGYVLVRHPCGFTVLDLADGDILSTGTGSGIGTAGVVDGIVYSVRELVEDDVIEGYAVDAAPLVGDEAPGIGSGSGIAYTGRVWARVVDGALYVMSEDQRLVRHTATLRTRWETRLPVLRAPVIVRVGKVLVITSDDGSVYGVVARDGRVIWRQSVDAVDDHYLISVRRRGDAAVVTARPGAHGPEVFALDAVSGARLPGSPRADPKDPPLVARGEGWTVSIVSGPTASRGS